MQAFNPHPASFERQPSHDESTAVDAQIIQFPNQDTGTTPGLDQRGLMYRLRDLVGLNPVVEPPAYRPDDTTYPKSVEYQLAQVATWADTKRKTDRS